jgi:hypothetical protein
MAKFLRDRQIKNLSITKTRIKELFDLCNTHAESLVRGGLPALDLEVKCMIRFDEKGYTVFNLGELFTLYEHAHEVERLVFTIETRQSLDTNRRFGPFLELTLDKTNRFGFLTVSSDDRVWVEAAFSALNEAIVKSVAWYAFVRTVWTELMLQVSGVAGIFLLSLLAAKHLSPSLAVENSFLIAFLFAFLLAANVWGFLQRQMHLAIESVFPNVQFVRVGKEHLHWVYQACVSAIVGLVIASVIGVTWNVLLGASRTVFGG